jgi:hypothetical protein
MNGKLTSNITIFVTVVTGLLIAAGWPSQAEAFQQVALSLAPIMTAHMGAIWLGNKSAVAKAAEVVQAEVKNGPA